MHCQRRSKYTTSYRIYIQYIYKICIHNIFSRCWREPINQSQCSNTSSMYPTYLFINGINSMGPCYCLFFQLLGTRLCLFECRNMCVLWTTTTKMKQNCINIVDFIAKKNIRRNMMDWNIHNTLKKKKKLCNQHRKKVNRKSCDGEKAATIFVQHILLPYFVNMSERMVFLFFFWVEEYLRWMNIHLRST